jgi:hypothetical protein
MANHVLKGSERQPIKGARSLGKADPAERLEVTILLRHRAAHALRDRLKDLHRTSGRPAHIKREEFAQQFGAEPSDIEEVKKFARSHSLTVVQERSARRTVVLAGTVAQLNGAFGVDLERFEHDGGSYRGRTGPIHLPDELHGKVEGVFGLDDRQQARPHFRSRLQGNVHWRATSNSFTPTQMAALYDYPMAAELPESLRLNPQENPGQYLVTKSGNLGLDQANRARFNRISSLLSELHDVKLSPKQREEKLKQLGAQIEVTVDGARAGQRVMLPLIAEATREALGVSRGVRDLRKGDDPSRPMQEAEINKLSKDERTRRENQK